MLRPGCRSQALQVGRRRSIGSESKQISNYGLELGWGCSSHLTPLYEGCHFLFRKTGARFSEVIALGGHRRTWVALWTMGGGTASHLRSALYPDQIYRPDVCGIRRQPMFHNWSTHLTSSLLSGELDSYDAEPEGVNEGFSFMKLRSIAVLPSSPDTDLKLFKVREQSLVRTDALGEGRQTLISHRAGRRAFHRNLNPGVLDEAGPLIRQPVSGKENPSMPVYHFWWGNLLSHMWDRVVFSIGSAYYDDSNLKVIGGYGRDP